MQAQYDETCLLRNKIYEWLEHFKQGRTSLCDDERSGSPSPLTTDDNVQVVKRIASIEHRYRTFRRRKANHSPPCLLGAVWQWSRAMLNGSLYFND
ncbi:hypothetical protein TNCV_1271521 [Trichonephila clavipes]|nr:hypothetical protein TNCV_1271521 [Trichonephila clavipes]